MNFTLKIPDRLKTAARNLNQTQLGVIIGAGFLVAAAGCLRLGLSGDWSFDNLMTSVGLLALDIGAGCAVHAVAKRRHQHLNEQHEYNLRRQELDVVVRKCEAITARRTNNEFGLAKDEAELNLRQSLDFGEEKRRWAAEMAISGFTSGVNSNRAATRPERRTA